VLGETKLPEKWQTNSTTTSENTSKVIAHVVGGLVAVFIFHRWLCAEWPFEKNDVPYLGQPPEDD
jgi:hypothetical protein